MFVVTKSEVEKKNTNVFYMKYTFARCPVNSRGSVRENFQWDFYNFYDLVVKPQRSYEPTSLEEQVTRGFLFFQLLAKMVA